MVSVLLEYIKFLLIIMGSVLLFQPSTTYYAGIMLALCSILLGTYIYAQNYASISMGT